MRNSQKALASPACEIAKKMQIFRSKSELNAALNALRNRGKSIGFVPTMGALHEGHISLVKKAKEACDTVIVSIFVNPTQFNNATDLARYPRIPEKDLPMLEAAGTDILFMPEVTEMYPEGAVSSSTSLPLGALGEVMEGKHRPGHFGGVTTIVRKLFEAVGECKAFFGQKDFQQLAVVRFMVKHENLPVEIISCPIIREADGLAMSSRNMRLTPEQRKAALVLSRALFAVEREWRSKSIPELHELVNAIMNEEPSVKLEYFEIADRDTLETATEKKNAVACIAAYVGEIRLIDNVILA
jgi:pantoate--beta-alanine ligase